MQSQRLGDWSISILKHPLFLQVAPLLVLFLLPLVVLLAANQLRRINRERVIGSANKIFTMVLDSLGISLPWLWGGSSSQGQVGTGSATGSTRSRKHGRKSSAATKVVRTRAEQIAMQRAANTEDSEYDDRQYYSGLVNISGTYCFMNSTLQAMASLTYLQPHIDSIHARAEALDVPTPVIDALQELFNNLNTPKSSYHSLRPHGIINALSSPQPSGRTNTSSSLFNSREHQDAQELFQLVSECIKNEMAAVDKEGLRDRGIAGVLELGGALTKEDVVDAYGGASKSSSVFDGLTANRRSCVMCGYTEAVMHFGFDNWQLALPRLATSCRLEDCLEDYTRLEILKDCICRKCSILATHKRLLAGVKNPEDALPTSPASSSSSTPFSPTSAIASSSTMPTSSPTKSKAKPSLAKKKKIKEVKKMEERVRKALEEGRIEDEALLEGIRLEKVVSSASTKQAMIARPPPVLALHLNRSVHYGAYASKNTIRVYFPEVLDLTPFTTSGSLSTVPTSAISTPTPAPSTSFIDNAHQRQQHPHSKSSTSTGKTAAQAPKRPTTPTQETYSSASQRTIYRLAAVVCHYGQHSFGHYVCYRRKPRRGVGGAWVPPTLVDPLRMEGEGDEEWDEDEQHNALDEGEDGDVETETDGDGTVRYKAKAKALLAKSKANGKAKGKATGKSRPTVADYFASGHGAKPNGRPTHTHQHRHPSLSHEYYWEDHTEAEAGTHRGWLRISDDAVEEVGIERVLGEAGGAFMLYYERAVQPRVPVGTGVYRTPRGEGVRRGGEGRTRSRSRSRSRTRRVANGNGPGDVTESDEGADTDADGLSIGSEETLKPQVKVVDLNGSVGALIGEVGVGVMKTERERAREREKEREKEEDRMMSMSLHIPGSSASSTTSVGARIIRNVSAGRRKLPTNPSLSNGHGHGDANGNGHGHGLLPLSSSSSEAGSSRPSPSPDPPSLSVNGSANGAAGHARDDLLDERVPHEMMASAPSILQLDSASVGAAGLGSKSTRVLLHPPGSAGHGVKVKAR